MLMTMVLVLESVMGEVTGGVVMLLLAPEEAEGICKLAGLEVQD